MKSSSHPKQPPTWLADAVFYQIFTQSYYDTNSDGIGDIPGIIAKLDYIQSIGRTAIQKLCNPWGEMKDGQRVDGGYFHKEKPGSLAGFLDNYVDHYEATRDRGYISLPSGNHDFARFNHGRSLAEQRVFHALRREYFALSNTAEFKPLALTGSRIPFVFQRGEGERAVVVAINPSDRELRVTCPVALLPNPILAEGVSVKGRRITLPPVSFGIFSVEDRSLGKELIPITALGGG